MPRLLAALLLAGLLSGCGQNATVALDDDGWNGTHLDEPWQASPLALTDTRGRSFHLTGRDGRVHVVFFGYTNCPDVCQVVMGTIASAVNRLSDAERRRVEVDFVTTDPARDTPQVLRGYLARFDPDFVGVTGPLPRIIAAAKPLKIDIAKGQRLPTGGYEVDHTAAVLGLRDGAAQVVWTQGTTPPALADDVRKLLKEQA